MTETQWLEWLAKVRAQTMQEVSEGSFLDGVFRIERYTRWDIGPVRAGAINLTEIYPDKNQQDLREALEKVKKLHHDALEYVSTILDKREGGEDRLHELSEKHPGFSKAVCDLAVHDAFVAMR